ncbi:polysaccharide biosynthesis C-terminal domain-containing protein [Arthrobacter bambusae]|uniref:UDP-2-acetamido-2,6-beta-L-arabino-hexul-4-ose reductase n=1 Tax=Arthrobacter bambusae TaxID=1338426 RepID=A0AAW8DDD6_9MICC|nr:capsular biosynthesis protein [Arthrobacter bambusae]MDP9904639.1 UDP-2-acetamido-2,6-beta-L-arabino-hexul-4-ose reductase [Arthrobacter bambusae]MDQ0129455.1 UDP-2-acetamido-2,6-beta-L-arabino-hexul-4-ose reductase [Arthrobacter bambusae]MDQ0180932.1 UDP-2-acetamido-2,6-beta-L-arabino-hexul-4-ose reductase [Arthrobacter bambusae]
MELGAAYDLTATATAISGSERLIHIAGVNRGNEDEVRLGNIELAQQLAQALRTAERPPQEVVYANSIQSGNGTIYGDAKAEAGSILKAAADFVGASYTDVLLPNLFGEHGRPFYNSVVATFCHLLQSGQAPEVKDDKELLLLHAQNAAEVLLGSVPVRAMDGLASRRTVSAVLAHLQDLAATYHSGDIPNVASAFDLDLFNTYRSFRVGQELPFALDRRADARGSFFEVCRTRGGDGQTSFSTTVPGVTRGQHFHRRKIERFVVLSGQAEIAMRRLFTDEVLRFKVDGSKPVAIDMPTLWTHNITNTGDSDLYTMFWTNDIFDPSNPDTFTEEV